MIFKNVIKGTGIAALSIGLLAGCSGEEATGDFLTDADVEDYYTQDDLTIWAEEQGFINQEGLDAWAEEQGFTTEEDLDLWASEEGLLDGEVTTETEEAVEGEEPAEEVTETDVDLGAIDENELQTTYLEPLGWTVAEFNDYVGDEHNMAIAEFSDFTELEETVGPVEDIQATE